jgi:type I restriction enzyme S subunit
MAGEWESATLGELGEFRNGVNFSQDDYGSGLPIINVKQLYGGRYAQTRELLELRPSAVKNAELVQLKPGDILFARSSVKASGAGQVAMVGACPLGTVFSGFIIRFRVAASDRAAPSFLNYVLRSPRIASF